MKILIVSTNAIGDAYISASAIQPLRDHFGAPEIHFLANTPSRIFLESLLGIDCRMYIASHQFKDIVKVLKQVRTESYDVVFSFFPGIVNSLFLLLCKSRHRLGYVSLYRQIAWHTKTHRLFVVGSSGKSVMWYPSMKYLQLVSLALESAQIPVNRLSKVMPIFVNTSTLAKNNRFVIHFRSKMPDRSLNKECLLRLVRYLQSINNMKVMLLGTSKDFIDLLNDAEIIKYSDFRIDLRLEELVGIITTCRLFIGIDSFPLHIADAYGSNYVGVFGPTNPTSVLTTSERAIKFEITNLQLLECSYLLKKLECFIG